MGQISRNSQIIWTSSAADRTVYCRKVLQEGNELLNIASAEMKNFRRSYPPQQLIDGNLNNFAHSIAEEDGMWVRVSLLETSSVSKIIIHNRHDCCKDTIIRSSLFIKSGEDYVRDCGTIRKERDSYEFNCIGKGDAVELKQEGNVGSWN